MSAGGSSAASAFAHASKDAAAVDVGPASDVALPKRQPRERRRSTAAHTAAPAAPTGAVGADTFPSLPRLRDARTPEGRASLVLNKLKACEDYVFDFYDPDAFTAARDAKRETLLELVEHVGSVEGQKEVFNEDMLEASVSMVAANLFRELPPPLDDVELDQGEDDPVLDPAWPHLQVVYEYLVRMVSAPCVKAKWAKKIVSQGFCSKIVDLFDSEDPRERDYLKTALHRLYGKFMSHRAFLRRTIGNVFFRFVFETGRHNGIAELLEILGAVINGFTLPLKQEHIVFLERALLPLHRPRTMAKYHMPLAFAVAQFVEKDPATAETIVMGIIKVWPWTNSAKQVLFLNELEEIMELMPPEQTESVNKKLLFRHIAKCIGSDHFQVAERALFLWNNEPLYV